MKMILTLAAAAALCGSVALAQRPTQTPAPTPAQAASPAAGHDHGAMSPAEMHEHCKAVMGHKMDPKALHEHSRDKSGISAGPKGKPPTEAEMKKLHEECARRMKPGA